MILPDLPKPLVPRDCDLRDLPAMLVDTDRLLRSDTWQLASCEERGAAMTLWLASWHQVPAASLPAQDRILANLALAGDCWKRVRDHAMRGWIACSDQRLYHPVIAEKALEAWLMRLDSRLGGSRGNAKRWHGQYDSTAVQAQIDESCRLLMALNPQSKILSKRKLSPPESLPESGGDSHPESPPVSPKYRKLEAVSSKALKATAPGQKQAAESAPAVAPAPAGTSATREANAATWSAYSNAYRERYSADPVRNAKVNGQINQLVQRLGTDDAPRVAEFYISHNGQFYITKGHGVGLLLQDAEKLHTEWKTGNKIGAPADKIYRESIADRSSRDEAAARRIFGKDKGMTGASERDFLIGVGADGSL